MNQSISNISIWPETKIRKMGKLGFASLRRRRRLKELTLLILIFMTCALFYVWSRVDIVRQGYKVAELTREREKLLETQKALHVEVATLKSPIRLEKIAQSKFKMFRPEANQIAFVKEQ